MQIAAAQFSVKFLRRIDVRRKMNDIEDVLSVSYGAPQAIPVPDDFAADAPRMIFVSKNGHSRVLVSQISIDFEANFDDEFTTDFEKTKQYMIEKIKLLVDVARKMGIDEYCYCGLVYSLNIESTDMTPIAYMDKELAGFGKNTEGKLYDASWRKSYSSGEYFMNEQVGINRRLENIGSIDPDLVDFERNKVLDEAIGVLVDINDRCGYVKNGKLVKIDDIDKRIKKIFSMMENYIKQWGKGC